MTIESHTDLIAFAPVALSFAITLARIALANVTDRAAARRDRDAQTEALSLTSAEPSVIVAVSIPGTLPVRRIVIELTEGDGR